MQKLGYYVSPHLYSIMIACSSTIATVMRTVYGIEVTDSNDKYVKIAMEAGSALFDTLIPGKFLVDILPICE